STLAIDHDDPDAGYLLSNGQALRRQHAGKQQGRQPARPVPRLPKVHTITFHPQVWLSIFRSALCITLPILRFSPTQQLMEEQGRYAVLFWDYGVQDRTLSRRRAETQRKVRFTGL